MPSDKEIKAVASEIMKVNMRNTETCPPRAIYFNTMQDLAKVALEAAESVRNEDRDDLLRNMRCDAVFESNYVKMPQPLYNRMKGFIKGGKETESVRNDSKVRAKKPPLDTRSKT